MLEQPFPGNVKAAMREAGAKSADLWVVPFDELKLDPEFNERDTASPRYAAHLEWLTGQMVLSGYKREKPMEGYVVRDGDANVVYITDGHTRYAAIVAARAQGVWIENVPVIVHEKGTNALDLVSSLITSNSGLSLEPLETARVLKRMLGLGLDDAAAAQRSGYTVAYVRQLLGLLSAPAAVRDMVSAGQVSATLAAETVKQQGPAAVQALQDGLEAAQAAGKKRVTAKHLAPPTRTEVLPPSAVTLIRDLLTELQNVGVSTGSVVDRARLAIA